MKEAKLQWAGTNRPKYSATLNRKGECWVLRRQMEWWQDGLSSPNGFNKLTDSFLPHTVFFPLYLPLFLLLFMSFISIGAGTKFGPLKTFFRWCHCSPRVVMGFCCWAGCQLLVVAHGSPPPFPSRVKSEEDLLFDRTHYPTASSSLFVLKSKHLSTA